ncbi:MAG: hypothetical protein QOE45_1049 [Frankiaceae bacterium]|jgi:hypothetical protein|nr:hypothetical protein [Frankiaceae bacterium]
MKYMLLIHVPADDDTSPHVYAEYGAFAEELGAAGKMLAGEELADPKSATLVRLRDGERMVTDGPFAETREHLAGFFLVEAADHDEAVGYAAKIPGARTGTIEVRALAEEH